MRRVKVLAGQTAFDFWRGRVIRRVAADRRVPVEVLELRQQIAQDEVECRRLHRWRGRPAIGRVV